MRRGEQPDRESPDAHSAFTPTKRNLKLALVAFIVTTLLLSTFILVVAAASGQTVGVKLETVYGDSLADKSEANVITPDEVSPEQYSTLLDARDSPQEVTGDLADTVENASYVEHNGNYYKIEMVPVPKPTNPIAALTGSGHFAWLFVAGVYVLFTPIAYSFIWDAAQTETDTEAP